MEEGIAKKYYFRQSSFMKSRALLLLTWLSMCTILNYAYKGTLLSTLIAISYEAPLDTIDQMAQSGLPLYVWADTIMAKLIETDQRESIMQLNETRVAIPFRGPADEEYLDLLAKLVDAVFSISTINLSIPNLISE